MGLGGWAPMDGVRNIARMFSHASQAGKIAIADPRRNDLDGIIYETTEAGSCVCLECAGSHAASIRVCIGIKAKPKTWGPLCLNSLDTSYLYKMTQLICPRAPFVLYSFVWLDGCKRFFFVLETRLWAQCLVCSSLRCSMFVL